MPRPTKWRRVGAVPEITYFKPVGVPLPALQEVILSIEEAEAIRLKDLEGLGQEESSRRMHISRPTFQRVLESGRKKTAEALTRGKAIRVEGGNFEMARRRFRCDEDGQEWDVPFEAMVAGHPLACPQCHSLKVHSVSPPASGARARRRGRRGMGGW